MPATISIRRVEPRSEILKNRSSPPVGGAPTRTTFAVPVSVSAMPPPSGRQGAGPPSGEVDRSIGKAGGPPQGSGPRSDPLIGPAARTGSSDRPNLSLPRYPGGTASGRNPEMADPISKQRLTKAERKEEARRQRVEL